MNYKGIDLIKLSKLSSTQVDHVTCLECCKLYIAPATAECGHTLCHSCWRGRRTCPVCATHLDRKNLKPNLLLQSLTEHVQTFGEAFEKLFKVKLNEFFLDTPNGPESSVKDPDKNVKEWLTSSQNHFSAPIQNSETFSQDPQQPSYPNPVKLPANNIIIHTETKKNVSTPKVVHVPPPQDDWDKIETLVEPENKQKSDNVVGPMDIEPFYIDDDEYTTKNPRRSSRRKDTKMNDSAPKSHDLSSNKHSSKDSSGENEKKLKNTWSNVKRMRKEFSKLNKKNRNKLNVSIEMVKKTQIIKPLEANTPVTSEQVFNIDENTPEISNKENYINNNQQTNTNVDKQDIISKDIPSTSEDCVILEKTCKSNNQEAVNELENIVKMPFIRKSTLIPEKQTDSPITPQSVPTDDNSDDIEITIKIGSTITNIVIKKKTHDVQIKLNNDQEVQTSLGPYNIVNNTNKPQINVRNVETNTEISTNTEPRNNDIKIVQIQKTIEHNTENSESTKKNTASAETATAQFEITESVEKELSNAMELDVATCKSHINKKGQVNSVQAHDSENIEDLNDIDMFNSGSVKEAYVHNLREPAPSEILVSTAHTKAKSQKRDRENNNDDEPKNKKVKCNSTLKSVDKTNPPDSEPINYDSLMGQVFANIDADIEEIRKTQEIKNNPVIKVTATDKTRSKITQTFKTQTIQLQSQKNNDITSVNEGHNQKDSENVFSVLEKENDLSEIVNTDKIPQQLEELLTPVLCRNLDASQESLCSEGKARRVVKPSQEDDSDHSVVEETPQKNLSFGKLKRTSAVSLTQTSTTNIVEAPKISSASNIKSIINLTDTVGETNQSDRDITIIDTNAKKHTMETPLTISKFTDQIKHKSTPVAKKSLNFENNMDPELTLCPSEMFTKTTQEKEFMNKVFENTPTTAARKLTAKSVGQINYKYCLAGSCLTPEEAGKVKTLCRLQGWRYVDSYTKDLTHLVVGVDEERRAQRSVKYMCALAASKWIVSFDWVQKCLLTKDFGNEEHYEALDSTGEPGPKRSRISKHKLFQGLTFYCMPPFGVLDIETLKCMLVASGGRVVNESREIQITEDSYRPALLLAEPELTQEDRFIYLAMEQSIVPVNYEWILNCLGSYSLGSILDLLLCPSTLLPAATKRWPEALMTQEYD